MRIRSGDIVKVVSGRKGVKGQVLKVLSVDRQKNRVVLENGPINKKHLKPERSRKNPEGGIVEKLASIHLSNVMLMSEKNDRPVRVGFKFENGQKIRVAKGRGSSGERV